MLLVNHFSKHGRKNGGGFVVHALYNKEWRICRKGDAISLLKSQKCKGAAGTGDDNLSRTLASIFAAHVLHPKL